MLVLQPFDWLWLSTTNLKLTCPSKMLGPKFVSFFPIKERVNSVSYNLIFPDSFKIHPVFHVALLKPVSANPFLAEVPNLLIWYSLMT